jgi:uncharacterized protein YecE (DUF72 family)
MSRTSIPIWFGTAGYSWPEWIGPFYPPGTTPERMASFYATQFPCVEINSTFYKPPAPGQLERLADRTPPGFQFSLKVPRTVSHEFRVHDLEPFRKAADELTRAHRLIGMVLQFPEMFRDTAKNREWVERVLRGLYPNPVYVEFRHVSWQRPRLGDWLRQRGGELAAIDVPELPQLFPRAFLDPGTSRVYARLHSRVTENWNGPGKMRYDFDYPDVVLREWVNVLRVAAPRLTEVYLMFNNCQGVQAVQNARRMAELVRAEAPEFHVVDPPPPLGPRQGTLFD